MACSFPNPSFKSDFCIVPSIKYSLYESFENIKSILLKDGKICEFELSLEGKWKKLTPSQNSLSFFNQEVIVINYKKCYVEIKQHLFLTFPKMSLGLKEEKSKAASICDLVFIHFLGNGNIVVQGIELDANEPSGFTKTKYDSTRLRPRLKDVLLENEPADEWTVTGIAHSYAPIVSFEYINF